jgi:hypothetical protein
LNAKECEEVLAALVDHQGLTGEQAVTVIDEMAQSMDGPDIFDALGMGHFLSNEQ